MRQCFICGRNGNSDPLDKHHIFRGANRKLSEKYGLYVYLCHWRCHLFSQDAVHNNAEAMRQLREYGQRKWMEASGGSIEEFRAIFGRNYLGCEIEEVGQIPILAS